MPPYKLATWLPGCLASCLSICLERSFNIGVQHQQDYQVYQEEEEEEVDDEEWPTWLRCGSLFEFT